MLNVELNERHNRDIRVYCQPVLSKIYRKITRIKIENN